VVLREFRDFINKGNFIDIAVAFVIGAAFGRVITALTDRIVSPLIALVIRLPSLEGLGRFGQNGSVGAFVEAFLNFLIIAFVMFMVVKAYNRFRETDGPSGPPEDIALLREIRDALRSRPH
jgi:large conductance mechanosensitive channel